MFFKLLIIKKTLKQSYLVKVLNDKHLKSDEFNCLTLDFLAKTDFRIFLQMIKTRQIWRSRKTKPPATGFDLTLPGSETRPWGFESSIEETDRSSHL